MSFSIESILNIDGLKEVRIVAGETGIARSVKWVTILEVLDELTFLDEGDLLVTTGYGLEEDSDLQNKLIPYLAEKKLAGIAFQPGFSLTKIPQNILKAADKIGFPILILPKNLSFSKFTRHILRNLINHQFNLLEYSQKIYHQLTQIVLNDRGLSAIANSLMELIGRPILFVDLFYNPLVSSLPKDNGTNNWKQFISLIQRASTQPGTKTRIIVTPDNQQLILIPITTGSDILGFLCVLDPTPPMEEMDTIAVQHAATLAALIMLKENAVKETENQLKEYFIEETLKGTISPQTLSKKAAAFGYDHKKGYYLVLMDFVNWFKITESMQDKGLYNLKNYILSLLEHCISKYGLSYMHKFTNENLLVLIQVKDSNSKKKIVETMKQIKKILLSKNKDYLFSAGISNYYTQLEKLEEAHMEASRALELGKVFNNFVTLFSDIEIHNLFYDIAHKNFSKNFYQGKLGVLLNYDRKHNTDLVATLERFFQCNCNLQKTASSLYIHRHTLKYRLQRINEITGLNPQVYSDRLKLQIAMILSKIIENNTHN